MNFCTCSMYFCCFVFVYSNSRHVVWMILWTVDKNWHETVGRVCRPVVKIMTLFQKSKMSFSTSIFRSGPRFSKGPVTFPVQRPIFKIKTIITWIKTPARFLKIQFESACYILSFFLILNWNDKLTYFIVHSHFSLENHYTISDQNVKRLYPFLDQSGAKSIPFGAAHTHMA